MGHDVFISYAAEDKATAEAVRGTLEGGGMRCWIAPRDVLPGMDYGEAIADSVRECRVMVLVFSARANSSEHVKNEVEMAVSAGKPVLPLRVEDVVPSGSLALHLCRRHWLDALTPPLEPHLRRLAESVERLLPLTKPSEPADAPEAGPAAESAPVAEWPTGTATFLFTDIEGSTKLWEQHPDAMHQALARHDALVYQAIGANGGHVFTTAGDAFCAAFATASAALVGALSAQRALLAEAWGETGPLGVRMALHTGEAELRQEQYFGPPLNRCATLLSAGHGGQILLSLAAAELVRDELPEGVDLRDLGGCRLRDLTRPEQVFQVVHSDLPEDLPPLRGLESFPTNLPLQATSFVGREREMAEVKRLLEGTRLLTVTGVGGVGKTRLALQVGGDLLDQFPDGVWLVELAALSDPTLVPQAVATALGVREEPHRPLGETVLDYLREKRLLLILDNSEHLIEACAELADAVLKGCPDVQLLATSREALGIAGEVTFLVPSLPAPEPERMEAAPAELAAVLRQYEAVQLFIDRGVAAKPGFGVTNENAPAVAQICWRLDGIPLAIELAAARTRALTAEQIADRLDDRFGLLTGGSRTALPRQRTLQAAIDWSYDLLSEKERLLLRRLSVFAGGWTLEAAEAVCADPDDSQAEPSACGIEQYEVLDLLSQLVEKSMVATEEENGEMRYRLLETVRQYAGERLMESGEAERLRERHRDFFVAVAERAEPELEGPDQKSWLDRLETEHDNLRAALAWCKSAADGAEAGLRLAAALVWFWVGRGHWREARAHLADVLAHEGAGEPTAARVKALNAAGHLAVLQGDHSAAWGLHEEALAISREHGYQEGVSSSLRGLGFVAWRRGDLSTTRALCEEALAISRECGSRLGIARSLSVLAMPAERHGDYARSRALREEALAIYREVGDKSRMAHCLASVGWVALSGGDRSVARAHFEESLTIRRELGDRAGVAACLGGLGMVARRDGDYSAARPLYEESLAISRELGNKTGIAGSLHELGWAAWDDGDYSAARAHFGESLAIRRELGNQHVLALSLGALAMVSTAQGHYAAARALYGESLAMWRALGQERDAAQCLARLAELCGTEDDAGRAARLLGAAEALREAIDPRLSPGERKGHDRSVAAVREALGDEAFEAAWAEGQDMTMDEAIAYALGEGDEQ